MQVARQHDRARSNARSGRRASIAETWQKRENRWPKRPTASTRTLDGPRAMNSTNHAADPGPLFLQLEERDLLHRVACELVAAAAHRQELSVTEFPLGRLMDYPVVGVFVTLRRQGQLRGCIGNFAASAPLGKALERAAVGVVSHDPRFPAVAPEELPKLTLDVSLLHSRELLGDTPQQRATQVVIGQHGLDILYRGRSGLLLPSVALDLKCDAVGFLQAACRKAHLNDDTWQNPEATIYRFSSISLGGSFRVAAGT